MPRSKAEAVPLNLKQPMKNSCPANVDVPGKNRTIVPSAVFLHLRMLVEPESNHFKICRFLWVVVSAGKKTAQTTCIRMNLPGHALSVFLLCTRQLYYSSSYCVSKLCEPPHTLRDLEVDNATEICVQELEKRPRIPNVQAQCLLGVVGGYCE